VNQEQRAASAPWSPQQGTAPQCLSRTGAGDTVSQQPLASQGDESGPRPTQGTWLGTASQAWRQGPRSSQEKQLVSQDGRGQGWAQTYLQHGSGKAWACRHELKGAPGPMGRGCVGGVTDEAGQGS